MFYSRPFLEQRIKEEKFRSCRTGSPFSMILFKPFQLVTGSFKNRKKTIKSLINFLDQETRETDIKGWWGKDTIAIILLDTLPEQGFLFMKKLISKIQGNGFGSAEFVRRASFKIIAFPNSDRSERQISKHEDSNVSKSHSSENRNNLNSLIDFYPLTFSMNSSPKNYQDFMKRCFDLALSSMGLVVLSPLFLLCGLLIKLDSRGPVFYRQTRVGKGGKFFTFLKFRSMHYDADQEIHKNHIKRLMNQTAGLSLNGNGGEKSYKLTDDNRVTWFGRFLRKTSIDELPQLINVLKGEMSLVGPRPHPVYEVEQYSSWYTYRLDVKPGITGLGQTYGRSDTEYEDVYRLDIRYLKMKNLILDFKILLKTIPIVLSQRGAN